MNVQAMIEPTARFLLRSCRLLAAMAGLALAEGAVLWLAGYEYTPRSALHQLSVNDFDLSDDERWGAAIIGVKSENSDTGRRFGLALYDLCRTRAVTAQLLDFQPQSIALSPSGNTAAMVDFDGSIYLAEHVRGRASVEPPGPCKLRLLRQELDGTIELLAFSPNDRVLAALGRRCIYLLQMPQGELLRCLSHECEHLLTVLEFSRDSRQLLSYGCEGSLCLWDVETGAAQDHVPLGAAPALSAALSDDAKRVSFLTADGVATVWRLAEQKVVSKRVIGPCNPRPASLSGEGHLAALLNPCEMGIQIHRIEASSAKRVAERSRPRPSIVGVRFARSGRLVSWDSQGGVQLRSTREPGNPVEMRLSPSLIKHLLAREKARG